MLGAGLKDIKNPRYNEGVFPVPWESDIRGATVRRLTSLT